MTYRIGDTINVTSGTGTISSSGVNLTGSGTNFDPEISVGTVIHAAGQTLVIATRTNDSTATVVTAPNPALSNASFTITAMVAVASLTADSFDPIGSFNRWVEGRTLANGLERALGRPRANWLWMKFIPVLQRAALKVYCPGKSARVYICTTDDPSNNTFVTYQAAMLWPDNDNLNNQDFSLDFRDLITL